MSEQMQAVSRPTYIDYVATDNSEFRLLKDGSNGGLCECTLGPGAITKPASHRVVEQLWYVVSGSGTLWRKDRAEMTEISVKTGDSMLIPVGVEFQVAAGEFDPLVMLISTMPLWQAEMDAGGPNEVSWDREWKPPSAEWRIQGDWWQLGAREDGTVQLAIIQLTRTGPLQYRLAGKSWGVKWQPRATFASTDATFMPEERILRYHWSGRSDGNAYAGFAEILFSQDDAINSATGYYDLSLGDGITDVVRMNAVYSRKEAADNVNALTRDATTFEEIVTDHFMQEDAAAESA